MKTYTAWYLDKKVSIRRENHYEARKAAAIAFLKFFPEKTWSEIFASRDLGVKQGVYR